MYPNLYQVVVCISSNRCRSCRPLPRRHPPRCLRRPQPVGSSSASSRSRSASCSGGPSVWEGGGGRGGRASMRHSIDRCVCECFTCNRNRNRNRNCNCNRDRDRDRNRDRDRDRDRNVFSVQNNPSLPRPSWFDSLTMAIS